MPAAETHLQACDRGMAAECEIADPGRVCPGRIGVNSAQPLGVDQCVLVTAALRLGGHEVVEVVDVVPVVDRVHAFETHVALVEPCRREERATGRIVAAQPVIEVTGHVQHVARARRQAGQRDRARETILRSWTVFDRMDEVVMDGGVPGMRPQQVAKDRLSVEFSLTRTAIRGIRRGRGRQRIRQQQLRFHVGWIAIDQRLHFADVGRAPLRRIRLQGDGAQVVLLVRGRCAP